MDVEDLKKKLGEIETITDKQWLSSLNTRKKKELEFHDLDRDKSRIESMDEDTYEKFYGNRKYYDGVGLSRRYINEWIRAHAASQIFLDYACGNGGIAMQAAKEGAKLAIGIDISSVSIKNARKDAEKYNVQENTYFVQSDAENTRLPDNCIDTIICSGMLHHLDLSYAFPELCRILAPGGRILAIEALHYNPLIRLYRHLTPEMRTEWEKDHILSLRDVRSAKRFFEIGEIRYWHLTSILTPYARSMLPLWNFIDGILTKVPLLQLMAWIFTFELIKPGNTKD